MKIVLWILGVLVVLAVLAYGGGMLLPRYHAASSTVSLKAEPESVWAAMRDLGGLPAWWSDVKRSERVADQGGHEAWAQDVSGFPMTFLVTADDPPTQFVTTIAGGSDAPFGGTWTYEVATTEGGARVRVTERGWIANPFFRLVTAITGTHGTLDSYLTALGAKFGETVTPEHVAPPPAPAGWPGP